MTDYLSDVPLVMFPGIGADARLFAPQQAVFPNMIVPPWLPPEQRETLEHYAQRLAATVPLQRPLFLGGQSFGGMIAWAMAPHLRPDALLLLATCHNRCGLRPVFRAICPIAEHLPPAVISMIKPFARMGLAIHGQLTNLQRDMLAAMFRETDSAFLVWAIGAILNWQPRPLEGIPVYHIHGRRDRMIPARGVQADAWIEDGTHLINYTHADEVNRFFATAIAEIAAKFSSSGKV